MALQKQDWSGLIALWRGVKRLGAMLAMALVGSVCGGVGGVFLLPCLYYFAIPVGTMMGLGVGLWIGTRIAPRDAVLVFVLAALPVWPAYRIASLRPGDTLGPAFAGGAVYLATTVAALGLGRRVPVRMRRPASVFAASGFALFVAIVTVRGLWFSG